MHTSNAIAMSESCSFKWHEKMEAKANDNSCKMIMLTGVFNDKMNCMFRSHESHAIFVAIVSFVKSFVLWALSKAPQVRQNTFTFCVRSLNNKHFSYPSPLYHFSCASYGISPAFTAHKHSLVFVSLFFCLFLFSHMFKLINLLNDNSIICFVVFSDQHWVVTQLPNSTCIRIWVR